MLRTYVFTAVVISCGGLASSTTAFAWQTTTAFEKSNKQVNAAEGNTVEEFAVDEFAIQDKDPAKPKETSKPPLKPPPLNQTRPAPPVTPPAPVPPRPEPQFNPFVNPQANQSYLTRLSRAPDMFGDSFLPLTAIIQSQPATSGTRTSVLDLPLAGGSRRFKNEHSRAMPTDRVFGTYHHFHNALESNSLTPGFASTSANVDRFTLGFEKTFADGNASVELRLPLSAPISMTTTDSLYRTDTVGDLVVTLKGLLYSDDSQAVALGLAINTPTGNDLTVSLPNSGGGGANFTLDNNAVHLIPFLAYQAAPSDDFFFNSFLQFDTPTNSNSAQVRNIGAATVDNLKINEQTLLYLDTSFGYWMFRDPEAEFLTGLAGLLELHYTTTLNSTNAVSDRDQIVTFASNSGRLDVLNLTVALHTEISRSTTIRAGFVTPLRGHDHRFFDSEFTVAVIFRR